MSFKRNLATAILALTLPLSLNANGRQELRAESPKSEYVEAIVIDELEIPAETFGYAIQMDINGEVYTAKVSSSSFRDKDGNFYYKSIEALALAIKRGTKIRVSKKALEKFSEDGIGGLYSTEIFLSDRYKD